MILPKINKSSIKNYLSKLLDGSVYTRYLSEIYRTEEENISRIFF
jgi:hypothetical protein